MSTKTTSAGLNDKKNKSSTVVNNKRTCTPVFNADYRAFVIYNGGKMQKIPGLTKVLKKVFWPDYKYQSSHFSISTGAKDSYDGINRGKTVHSQIDYWFKSPKERLNIEKTVHPYTRKIISAMRMWKMQPFLSEHVVWDKHGNLCTAIDAIVKLEDGSYAVVEWKCGFDGYIERGNGFMHVPHRNDIPNSPLNQAFFQLAFGCLMLRNFTDIKFSHAYVIQINQEGIAKYELPEYFNAETPILYSHLITQKNKPKTSRSKKMKRN